MTLSSHSIAAQAEIPLHHLEMPPSDGVGDYCGWEPEQPPLSAYEEHVARVGSPPATGKPAPAPAEAAAVKPASDGRIAKAIAMLEPADVSVNESDEEREAIEADGDTVYGVDATIPSRPIIVVHPGTLSELATLGEAAIIAAGERVYRRGAVLVRPVIEDVDASDGRRTKVAQPRR